MSNIERKIRKQREKDELLNIKKHWTEEMNMSMEYKNNEGYISNESMQQELYKLKEKFNSDRN